MRSISATDAQEQLPTLLEDVDREPVVIRDQRRDIAVLLSTAAYDRLREAAVSEFQRFCDEVGQKATNQGMKDEVLADLLAREG
jgi:hypothetical protein